MTLNFVIEFLCIYWDNHIILLLKSIDIIYYYLDWFLNVEPTFYSWDKLHFIIGYHIFRCFWILFVIILLRNFASIYEVYDLLFSFLSMSFSDIDIRLIVATKKWVGKCFFPFNILYSVVIELVPISLSGIFGRICQWSYLFSSFHSWKDFTYKFNFFQFI